MRSAPLGVRQWGWARCYIRSKARVESIDPGLIDKSPRMTIAERQVSARKFFSLHIELMRTREPGGVVIAAPKRAMTREPSRYHLRHSTSRALEHTLHRALHSAGTLQQSLSPEPGLDLNFAICSGSATGARAPVPRALIGVSEPAA